MTKSWKRIGAYLGILTGTLWVVFTTIAMLTFPGGYLFFDYPISALGLTVINSTPSMLNYFLFVTACTGAAVCLVPLHFKNTHFVHTHDCAQSFEWTGNCIVSYSGSMLGSPCYFRRECLSLSTWLVYNILLHFHNVGYSVLFNRYAPEQ